MEQVLSLYIISCNDSIHIGGMYSVVLIYWAIGISGINDSLVWQIYGVRINDMDDLPEVAILVMVGRHILLDNIANSAHNVPRVNATPGGDIAMRDMDIDAVLVIDLI